VKLTETQVRYIANLANLNLTESEVARMALDLDSILGHMDSLAGIDTTGIEPMAQVVHDAGDTATLRPDVERAPLENALALANAPSAGNGCFKVPRVIER
jgi:aspartyl-tRNA(Asn)/glutamyl-tRNA(Gln) amidotransferase subunit C